MVSGDVGVNGGHAIKTVAMEPSNESVFVMNQSLDMAATSAPGLIPRNACVTC